MSTPFTAPAGATWQSLLNETTLAYSERRQAIGQAAYTPTAETNVQSSAYWRILQEWLETNCTSFIDHVNGPLNDAGNGFLLFTRDSWRAAAGLNANGFRRKYGPKESLTTDYGQMYSGDVIGPWIFEDLQKGFGALKWNVRVPGEKDSIIAYYKWGSGNSDYGASSCVVNRANADASFSGDWKESAFPIAGITGGVLYFYSVRTETIYGGTWAILRIKTKITLSALKLPGELETYGKASGENYGGSGTNDVDKLFGADLTKLSKMPFSASFSASDLISFEIGDISSNPAVLLGWNCPTVFRHNDCAISTSGLNILLKWNFTNT